VTSSVKLTRFYIIAGSVLVAITSSVFAQDDEVVEGVNEVVVRAHRFDTDQFLLGRQRKMDTTATQQDFQSQWEDQAAVDTTKSPRTSATGFAAPALRGQDGSYTSVYVNGLLIQNPYTGAPVFDELDLGAFDRANLFQGFSHFNLDSVNPFGTLVLENDSARWSSQRVGLVSKVPSAHQIWGRFGLGRTNAKVSLYARNFQTSGRYTYYSDEGTPYNETDDQIRIQDNNDQRSWSLMPAMVAELESWDLKLFSLRNHKSSGAPSLLASRPSLARLLKDDTLAIIGLDHKPIRWAEKAEIRYGFQFHQLQSQSIFSDPDKLWLQMGSEATMPVRSSGIMASSSINHPIWKARLSMHQDLAMVETAIDGHSQMNATRRDSSFYGGLAVLPISNVDWESKIGTTQLIDHVHGDIALGSTGPIPNQYRRWNDLAELMGIHTPWVDLFGQWGLTERAPTLFEQYGNGYSVRANPLLENERITHVEAGVERQWSWVKMQTVFFRDGITNKIAVVPVDSNVQKAQNVERSVITGEEINFDWAVAEQFHLIQDYVQLNPKNTSSDQTYALPKVPQKKMVLTESFSWDAMNIKLRSRYRSKIYLDTTETIEAPALWIHDLSFDLKVSGPAPSQWKASLYIKNLLNEMSGPIESGTSIGRTGREEFEPRPGRGLSLGVSTEF
jgi:hypothetical protein